MIRFRPWGHRRGHCPLPIKLHPPITTPRAVPVATRAMGQLPPPLGGGYQACCPNPNPSPMQRPCPFPRRFRGESVRKPRPKGGVSQWLTTAQMMLVALWLIGFFLVDVYDVCDVCDDGWTPIL